MKTDTQGNLPPHAWARIFAGLVLTGMLLRWVVVPVVEWAL